MEKLLSILIYVAVGLVCILVSRTADKNKKRAFWIIVILLTLLAGFRHESVGIDTPHYVELLSQLRDGFKDHLNNIDEKGFLALSYVIVNITKGYTWLLTVFSFIINFFVIKRLFDEKDNISLPWAMYIFMCQYYFMTFNTIRQWIAIAIIFYFSKYVGKGLKGNMGFVLAVAVATLFHKTALLAIALVIVYYVFRKSKSLGASFAKMGIVIVAPVAAIVLLDYMQKHYGAIYAGVQTTGDVSIVTLARLALLGFLMVFSFFDEPYSLLNFDPDISLEEKAQAKQHVRFNSAIMLLGIACTMMIFFYKYADRLALYFMVYELIVLPYYVKNSRVKGFIKVFVILLFGYLRFMSFRANGYGEMPYLPFWANI